MKFSGWPEPGELAVGEVDDVNEDRGVYVDLDEYEDKRGFVHISEVASGWIKNVRDHVSEGQTVVVKVLDVNESSRQINLSIKDVNDHQRKEKIQGWKNAQKADNWMELAFGEDMDDEQYSAIANALLAEFGSPVRRLRTGRHPRPRGPRGHGPRRGRSRRHRRNRAEQRLGPLRHRHGLRRPDLPRE